MQGSSVRGVSAIELMLAVTLLAVIVAMGMSSWQGYAAKVRRQAATDQLLGHIALARSAAISKGRAVAVSKTGAEWHAGWRVHIDANRNGSWEQQETIFAEHQGDAHVQISGSGVMANYVLFDADGRPRQVSGAFLSGRLNICSPRGGASSLVMSASGRVRQENGQTYC